MAVGKEGHEKERSRENTEMFPMGGVEATSPKNMQALYAYVWSWGMEQYDRITFPKWKVFYEYQEPIEHNSLSANFAVVFP